MSRINKSELTKLEILQVACRLFLERGYSSTSVRMISDELEMSTGNVTFYFPTKEHMLAELVHLLCAFQFKIMEEEADEGISSIMAVCLELATVTAACHEDEIAKDFFVSAYQSPLCLEIIRENDTKRAKEIFNEYCKDLTHEQFYEREVLVSGIEYSTIMETSDIVSLELQISSAIRCILSIFDVPEDVIKTKIRKVLSLDFRSISRRVFKNFRKYVEKNNEQAFYSLFKG